MTRAQRRQQADREARRAQIESLSIRPHPGTSDLLHRSLSQETFPSPISRVKEVEVFDLVDLAPMHLIGGSAGKVEKVRSVMDLVWGGAA